LTLDLSESNPFTRPPPPPPLLKEEDLMDIDLPEDFVFPAPSEDSNRESHHSPIPIPSPATKVVEEVHSSSEVIVFTDSDPSEDRLDGGDEVMSSPEADSNTDDEDEEMSSSKHEKEDPMEDLSLWAGYLHSQGA